MSKIYISLLLLIFSFFKAYPLDQLAVVVIIDQFSYNALQKIAPHTHGGIRTLLDHALVYENAHFPYARTSTGPGHATINTGALPKEHGIVANYWYNTQGKKVPCDYDTEERAAIVSPTGFYKKSKSAQHAKVDGISDQLILTSNTQEKNCVYALSLKSRAAIFSAGRLGKAIFFDSKSGNFTSSKAYFDTLPAWVKKFNKKSQLTTRKEIPWKLAYPKTSPAYSMVIDNYTYARLPMVVEKDLTPAVLQQDAHKKHNQFDFITYSPQSNKLLFDLAKKCLKNALHEKPKNILLWVSLSSLDKIGHIYGPDSFEYVDTLYHIDAYLQEFMNHVHTKVDKTKTVFILTSDHGTTPIPELLEQKDFGLAKRILSPELEEKINTVIQKKYGIENCIKEVDIPSIFFDYSKLATLSHTSQEALLNDVKAYLKKQPGIKNVWTHQELEKSPAQPNDFTMYYKNQLFPGRTGSLLYQTFPYTYVTDDPKGTGHVSCYDYTTHVPLFMYYPEKTEHKKITQRVSMAQVAPTLAQRFSVSPPSACVENPLPE